MMTTYPDLRCRQTYLGNPWGLTLAECQVLVLMPDCDRAQIARALNISQSGVQSRLRLIYERMRVNKAEHAAVYFDRWWQNWQRLNPQSAQEARDQLGL